MILLLVNVCARMVSLESTVHARGKPMSVTRQYPLVMRQLEILPACAKWLSIPSKQTVQVSNYYRKEPKCHFHLHLLDKDIDIGRFNLVIFIPPPNRTRMPFIDSGLPSSKRYGAEAKPRCHIKVKRGEAVNQLIQDVRILYGMGEGFAFS